MCKIGPHSKGVYVYFDLKSTFAQVEQEGRKRSFQRGMD